MRFFISQLFLVRLRDGGLSQALQSQILTALSFLLSSLAICDENAVSLSRYAFLIYNASVHYWNIARPLLREGTRPVLIESLGRVVEMLEKMGGVHATLLEVDAEWLGQYLCLLAT